MPITVRHGNPGANMTAALASGTYRSRREDEKERRELLKWQSEQLARQREGELNRSHDASKVRAGFAHDMGMAEYRSKHDIAIEGLRGERAMTLEEIRSSNALARQQAADEAASGRQKDMWGYRSKEAETADERAQREADYGQIDARINSIVQGASAIRDPEAKKAWNKLKGERDRIIAEDISRDEKYKKLREWLNRYTQQLPVFESGKEITPEQRVRESMVPLLKPGTNEPLLNEKGEELYEFTGADGKPHIISSGGKPIDTTAGKTYSAAVAAAKARVGEQQVTDEIVSREFNRLAKLNHVPYKMTPDGEISQISDAGEATAPGQQAAKKTPEEIIDYANQHEDEVKDSPELQEALREALKALDTPVTSPSGPQAPAAAPPTPPQTSVGPQAPATYDAYGAARAAAPEPQRLFSPAAGPAMAASSPEVPSPPQDSRPESVYSPRPVILANVAEQQSAAYGYVPFEQATPQQKVMIKSQRRSNDRRRRLGQPIEFPAADYGYLDIGGGGAGLPQGYTEAIRGQVVKHGEAAARGNVDPSQQVPEFGPETEPPQKVDDNARQLGITDADVEGYRKRHGNTPPPYPELQRDEGRGGYQYNIDGMIWELAYPEAAKQRSIKYPDRVLM